MKRVYILIFLLISFVSCYGQNDHLKPANFETPEILKEYYASLFPILYSGFNDKPVARYTLIPSFSSEFAFSIEIKANQFLIISNSLSTSYWGHWYAKDKSKVKVRHASTKINEELYNAITTLFNIVEKQTQEPKTKIEGLDGETSYFSSTVGDEVKTGESWSPNENSRMGKLVKVCKELYLIGNGQPISQSVVLTEINQLILGLR
jgi:hypothetical protein